MARIIILVCCVGVLIAGCAKTPQDALVGTWTYHEMGGIYSARCPMSLTIKADGKMSAGGISGTYQKLSSEHIVMMFDSPSEVSGFASGTIYEFKINNGILSLKAPQFYCEFTT